MKPTSTCVHEEEWEHILYFQNEGQQRKVIACGSCMSMVWEHLAQPLRETAILEPYSEEKEK